MSPPIFKWKRPTQCRDRRRFVSVMNSKSTTKSPSPKVQSKLLWVVLAVAVVWPPVYSLLLHPFVEPSVRSSNSRESQLLTLLDARRYTLSVPTHKDGWYIGLETVINGQSRFSGASSVTAGEQITVLVRRHRDTSKIEYCMISEMSVSRGVIDDPLVKAGVTSNRTQGSINSGDWLYRGGREQIQQIPDRVADFEVRLVLEPPDVPGEA